MAVHILGYRRKPACPNASTDAIAEARKFQAGATARKDSAAPRALGKRSHSSTSTGAEGQGDSSQASMPPPPKRSRQANLYVVAAKDLEYQPNEIGEIQKQACRAIISSNAPYRLFENLEMCKLFDMVRRGTSEILPTGKAASGSLLNQCADDAEAELKIIFREREVGAS